MSTYSRFCKHTYSFYTNIKDPNHDFACCNMIYAKLWLYLISRIETEIKNNSTRFQSRAHKHFVKRVTAIFPTSFTRSVEKTFVFRFCHLWEANGMDGTHGCVIQWIGWNTWLCDPVDWMEHMAVWSSGMDGTHGCVIQWIGWNTWLCDPVDWMEHMAVWSSGMGGTHGCVIQCNGLNTWLCDPVDWMEHMAVWSSGLDGTQDCVIQWTGWNTWLCDAVEWMKHGCVNQWNGWNTWLCDPVEWMEHCVKHFNCWSHTYKF